MKVSKRKDPEAMERVTGASESPPSHLGHEVTSAHCPESDDVVLDDCSVVSGGQSPRTPRQQLPPSARTIVWMRRPQDSLPEPATNTKAGSSPGRGVVADN